MFKRASALCVFVATSIIAVSSWAGPFGLEMSTPVGKLNVVKSRGDDIYTINVPRPNSEFESYIATVTPEEGLCKIVAIGKTHEGDASGVSIRSTFESMQIILREKYGPEKDFDFLHAGSIWDKSQEFSMSLAQKQRSLMSIWDRDEHSVLPSDISSILMDVRALNSDKTYLILSYEFSNFSSCSSHKEQQDKNAL